MMSQEAKVFAAQFAALGHAVRVEIVRRLLAAHPAGLVVGEIQQALNVPGSTLSHHLDALRQEGLVEQTREGRFLRYRAGTAALNGLLAFLYAECCQGSEGMTAERPPAVLNAPTSAAAESVSPAGDGLRKSDTWRSW